MSYNLDTNNIIGSITSSFGKNTWFTIATILAVIAAFLLYFLFVRPNKKHGNKFVNWIKGFLNFDELIIEPLIKILHIFVIIFIILTSFLIINDSFIYFLMYLIVGIGANRIAYELIMLIVGIYKNTKK